MAQARTQSNAMLYALITFVALFVVGVVCAVVFYIKSEEYRTQLETSKSEMAKIANTREQGAMGKIVGKTESGKTYMGTLSDHYNKLVSIVTGVVSAEDVSADMKYNDIVMQINALNQSLGLQDVSVAVGPDSISLIKQITDLKTKLDETRAQMSALSTQHQQLQEELKRVTEESSKKEQLLVEQVKKHEQGANDTQTQYTQLEVQRKAAEDERVGTVNTKLTEEQEKLRAKQMELTRTQEQLAQTHQSLKDALAKLEAIRPRPDRNVAAYQQDAGILRVDLKNGLVYLNVGSEDRVYRGLTFAVYDRNMPIPEDGKNKAEIEVFQVDPKVSVARILKSNIKNPIVPEDIVANLIWDSKTSNRFIVIGEFDLNNDGMMDPDGNIRVREMVERWGGKVENEISINTDFVVAGQTPKVPPKPDQAQLEIDSTLQQKYEASIETTKSYEIQLAKAGELSVPVFNQKRFLYLIGYDALLETNSAK
jgi:hypothetical protein